MKRFFKKLYQLIPFKKYIFLTIRSFGTPGKKIYKHLYFKGVFNVKVEDRKYFKIRHFGFEVENELFWKGLTKGWEKESMKLWIRLCRKSNVIVDVGANTGIYSLAGKAINPEAKIYAFEPVDRVFEKLEQNILLNSHDTVLVKKALSEYSGKATIYDSGADHIYSVTVNKNLSPVETRVKQIEIETTTLNEYIEDNKITRIDLMKIDVETHEPEVLIGFSKYLEKFRPTLLIEILTDEIGSRVQQIVGGLGYLYFNIDEQGAIRKEDTIKKSDYYNYLFCSEDVARDLSLV